VRGSLGERVSTLARAGAVHSLYRSDRPGVFFALALQRATPFADDERDLIDAFHAGCRELYEPNPELSSLPRRHRQILELLFEGNTEREIAAQRTLSVHTVHEYVKQIYTHFGVSSRPELLSLWVDGSRRLRRE
jgi:DNA-binding NarL/FixJ family response regulator